jgi:uncharacterized protein YllA (UPF0747 family)
MKFHPQSHEETPIARRVLALREEVFSGSPHLQGLSDAFLEARAAGYPTEARAAVVAVLRDQYAAQGLTEHQEAQLRVLAQPGAVTMTCGHQLVLGGGPLYVHSKIREVAALSAQWKIPARPVVSIFWMATEDHDVEEIRHISFGGKRYSMPLAYEGWATGCIPSEAVLPVIAAIEKDWGTHGAMAEQIHVLKASYLPGETLADATRRMMAHWHPTVLCLDASDARLKALASDLWKDEIQHQRMFSAQNDAPWTAQGWKPPVDVKPSTLFLLEGGRRTRLDYLGSRKWQAGSLQMEEDALLARVETQPATLSPNAILRPVYQECILPNVLYAGGAGEMEYWLQLISYFQQRQMPAVRMHLRTSLEWWPSKSWRMWQKLAPHKLSYHSTISEVREAWLREEGAPDSGEQPVTDSIRALVEKEYGKYSDLERSVDAWLKRISREEGRMRERARRAVLRMQRERWEAFLAVKSTQFPGSVESGGAGTMQERTWTALDLAYQFGQLPFDAMEEGLITHLDLHDGMPFLWAWMLPESGE